MSEKQPVKFEDWNLFQKACYYVSKFTIKGTPLCWRYADAIADDGEVWEVMIMLHTNKAVGHLKLAQQLKDGE